MSFPGPPQYRVLIVDDHASVRQGVRRLLSDYFQQGEQAEASSGDEAIEMVRNGRWDVVILDVNMPGTSGLAALRAMRELDPSLPVVMFSMFPTEQLALRFMAAGASAYINKGGSPEELVNAVRSAVHRRTA